MLLSSFASLLFSVQCFAISGFSKPDPLTLEPVPLHQKQGYSPVDSKPNFDLPVTYNNKVNKWINYYTGPAKGSFTRWLQRSYKYLPLMKKALLEKGMPQDLAYVAMIESGFSANATSHAQAVGYWQFIEPTALRYGLDIDWWIDERRDFTKSTKAAASYLEDLYKIFKSWYLTAAAYNMGEGRTIRLVEKYKTTNYWQLSKKKDFPQETTDYIPKLIAAMLIAKAPRLYGFKQIEPEDTYKYDSFKVPGGTDLHSLAYFLRIDKGTLLQLNSELTKGFVPKFINSHVIRVPKGHGERVGQYVSLRLAETGINPLSKDRL